MIRWLRKRRYDKCRAKGHPLTVKREVRYFQHPPEDWEGVADRVTEVRRFCNCGKRRELVDRKVRNITSLTMSSREWDELEDRGRFYL